MPYARGTALRTLHIGAVQNEQLHVPTVPQAVGRGRSTRCDGSYRSGGRNSTLRRRMPGLRVAAQVKEIRKARHLSQRQLASRMQVPRTYISKIENGKAIPTLGSLERLAAALEVDICQLVRDGRSARNEEMAEILADPFLAELAIYLPKLEALQRSLLLNHARDRARDSARDMSLGKRRLA